MKKLLLLSGVVFSVMTTAQPWTFETLDINSVRTGINSNGDLFWNYTNPQYHVPADSLTTTIFAGAAWIGGLDAGGNLHVAAQTYRQSGNDFYPGPVMNANAYSAASDAAWNQVWKINKTMIDSFLMWRANPSNFPGYVIPPAILWWPGNGDPQLGQAAQLAPYIDADADGVYNPQAGDYPCIKGDQALFVIFNDDRNVHGETGGNAMKVEVHAMLYAYNAPGTWLDTAVFLNYKIYNRSALSYMDTYWGQWTDFDIGAFDDDYIGSDVGRGMYYGYNGYPIDGPPNPNPHAYGAHPPAQGVVFLNGPLADSADGIDNDRDFQVDEPGETHTIWQFMYYDNDFTATGNPLTAADHYSYLSAYWKDGSPLTYGGNGYGGTTPTGMAYPGDSDPLGWLTTSAPQAPWSEASAGNIPHDRRGVGSYGPFTFEPGSSECIDFAYVFGRGTGDHMSGVAAMSRAADSSRVFYQSNNPCTCDENPLSVQAPSSSVAGIYPNPATESINIICGDNATGSVVELLDVNGRVVKTTTVLSGNSVMVATDDLAPGVYFVRVNKGSVVLTGKFIRN